MEITEQGELILTGMESNYITGITCMLDPIVIVEELAEGHEVRFYFLTYRGNTIPYFLNPRPV